MRTAGGQTTGVLLCGGSGHAMDGATRPLLEAEGAPVVQQVLNRLDPQVQQVLLSCNSRVQDYAQLGLPTITDAPSDAGPLAGAMAAVYASQTPWVFVCPGNAPHLPRNLVRLLYLAARRDGVGLAVPHDGKCLQPLYLLFHRSRGRELRDYLDLGQHKVCGFVEQMGAAVLDASAIPEAFQTVRCAADAAALPTSPTRPADTAPGTKQAPANHV